MDKIALVSLIKPIKSIAQYKAGRQKYFPYIIMYYPRDPRFLIRKYMGFAQKERLKDPELASRLNYFGLGPEKAADNRAPSGACGNSLLSVLVYFKRREDDDDA